MVRTPNPKSLRQNEDFKRQTEGLAVAGWGFVASVFCIGALASWQMAAPSGGSFFNQKRDISYEATGNIGEITPFSQNQSMSPSFEQISSSKSTKLDTTSGDAHIDMLRRQVVSLRREIETLRFQNERMDNRLSSLEKTASTATRQPMPRPTTSMSVNPAKETTTGDGNDITVSALASENDGDFDYNATGSITATSFTAFGIILGHFDRVTEAKERWFEYRSRHGATFVRYQPKVFKGLVKGKTKLTLVAGPFSNAADAATACANLQTKSIKCEPGSYLGDVLTLK